MSARVTCCGQCDWIRDYAGRFICFHGGKAGKSVRSDTIADFCQGFKPVGEWRPRRGESFEAWVDRLSQRDKELRTVDACVDFGLPPKNEWWRPKVNESFEVWVDRLSKRGEVV